MTRVRLLRSLLVLMILAPAPASAGDGVDCSREGAEMRVFVRQDAHARIKRGDDRTLRVNGRSCGGATTRNIATIVVRGAINVDGGVTLDLGGGRFVPGRGTEAGAREIEIDVDLGDGHDVLRVVGDGRDDAFRSSGLQPALWLNSDDDAEVTTSGIDRIVLAGRSGSDVLSAAGAGGDAAGVVPVPLTLNGGPGADVLLGGAGDDLLLGGRAADVVGGGPGSDVERGQAGDDSALQGAQTDAGDVVIGGDGFDSVSYASRLTTVTVTIDAAAGDGSLGEGDLVDPSTERVVGGAGDDEFIGNGSVNWFSGGAGDDRARGGGGDDRFVGGAGDDTFLSSRVLDGDDVFVGGWGEDRMDYSRRQRRVRVDLRERSGHGSRGEADRLPSSVENVTGSFGDDVLIGRAGTQVLSGGDGDDRLLGLRGRDFLLGGRHDDVLRGGWGDDTLMGGSGDDRVSGGPGADSCSSDQGTMPC